MTIAVKGGYFMTSILLLTHDTNVVSTIKEILIPQNYRIYISEFKDLILRIYMMDIKFIIVDMDDVKPAILNTLNDIKEMQYIPVLGIYSGEHPVGIRSNTLNYSMCKSEIPSRLTGIVGSFVDFKKSYDVVRECYDTIDMINNEIDTSFKKFTANGICTTIGSIEPLLQEIFEGNQFLGNKPSIILVFSKSAGYTNVDVYKNAKKEREPIIISSHSALWDSISIGNEFFLNCDEKKYSDIDNYKYIFQSKVLNKIGAISNFAGYSTTDTVIVGLNYKYKVTNVDAKIIKSLCININFINNIYNKFDEVNEAFKYTMDALARAGEAADDDTGNHIKRVNKYSFFIANELNLESDFVDKIKYSAQMHDVGKIHIPQTILKKNGKLTKEEFDQIKLHPIYGAKIIGNSPHLKMAAEIALNHHEKYDGSGYPNGIRAEEIPLSARIVALADIYDALRSPRIYKPAFSPEKTFEIITVGDGRVEPKHFDPYVLEIYKKFHKELDEIYEKMK
jgi:hypothetical protein